jgi:hypothetical protein
LPKLSTVCAPPDAAGARDGRIVIFPLTSPPRYFKNGALAQDVKVGNLLNILPDGLHRPFI